MFKLVIIDHQLELVTMPKRKRDIGRTYLSGNEKRKIKIAKENEAKNLCGAMEKFVVKKMLDVGEASEDSDSESVVTPSQEDILDDTAPAEPSHPTSPLVEIEPDHHVIGFISNHSDPATWPAFLTAAPKVHRGNSQILNILKTTLEENFLSSTILAGCLMEN